MSLFNFSEEEILTFFAVLVRYATLIAVLPLTGDRMVPVPAKILFALAVTLALFPMLVSTGRVSPAEAAVWGKSAGSLVGTISLEAIFGLGLGYVCRLLFDAISFGANLAGNFMGFAAASTYDPHQESQTQVVAEIQMALAMLIFLALDGHHLMLYSALDSYRVVGLGRAGLGAAFSQTLVGLTGEVLKFGVQIAAPVAISIFAVNVAFGVIAKAMPQLNVLVLSFSVTALVGLIVMFLSVPEFQTVSGNILGRMDTWMEMVMRAMAKDGG